MSMMTKTTCRLFTRTSTSTSTTPSLAALLRTARDLGAQPRRPHSQPAVNEAVELTLKREPRVERKPLSKEVAVDEDGIITVTSKKQDTRSVSEFVSSTDKGEFMRPGIDWTNHYQKKPGGESSAPRVWVNPFR